MSAKLVVRNGSTWPGRGLQGEAYATLNHSAAVTKTSATTSTSRFQGDLRMHAGAILDQATLQQAHAAGRTTVHRNDSLVNMLKDHDDDEEQGTEAV